MMEDFHLCPLLVILEVVSQVICWSEPQSGPLLQLPRLKLRLSITEAVGHRKCIGYELREGNIIPPLSLECTKLQ